MFMFNLPLNSWRDRITRRAIGAWRYNAPPNAHRRDFRAMRIQLHNTASGRKEPFTPRQPGEVTVYVCGPTVYHFAHIGNAVPAVAFDVLVRLLRVAYPRVTYVRNITDVDDKINAAAAAAGQPIRELAERYAAEYAADLAALGVREPDVEPRATEHIAEIVAMIETLMAAGNAYEADGHVLFHVPSDPEYGSLAKRTLDEMRDGARVEVAPYKKDPKDFVLWKPSTADLPGWDSPWGRGRPGWHIECSAMIRKHLGPVIDIHGGGSDLAFPHHENESAQSRCVNGGAAGVRYWLHNGMLTFGAGKMSKSEGNVVTIRELRAEHDGEALRYALLCGHYRQSLAWSDGLLAQANASVGRLYQALRHADEHSRATAADYENAGEDAFPPEVLAALADDVNTPKALAALHRLAADVHRAGSTAARGRARDQLLAGGWLLGLLGRTPAAYFRGEGGPANRDAVDVARIEALIAQRDTARRERDFARADAIRDELAHKGVEIEDTRNGTQWKVRRSFADETAQDAGR